jgi:hypothetical protein
MQGEHLAKSYDYGFKFLERDGRKVIRYRQDKLGFASGVAWLVFFTLISYFFLGGEDGSYTFVLPFVALGALVYWRSRMREISVGESDVLIRGKRYERAKIAQVFVEAGSGRQSFSPQAQNYDAIARQVALDPLGGSPVLAKASAMAADATTSFSMAVANGMNSTGRVAYMKYDGKRVVVAKWLSVQRAMMLSHALGQQLGFAMDADGASATSKAS